MTWLIQWAAPIDDIPAACQAIANDIRRWIDLGCVTLDGLPGKRYFANGIGIGFERGSQHHHLQRSA